MPTTVVLTGPVDGKQGLQGGLLPASLASRFSVVDAFLRILGHLIQILTPAPNPYLNAIISRLIPKPNHLKSHTRSF